MNTSSINQTRNNSSTDGRPLFGAPGGIRPPGPFSLTITTIQSSIALYGSAFQYILAFMGHTSSFLVFSRPTLRQVSTSCLFIALTIFDCVYLLVNIYDFINVGFKIPDSSIDPSAMCRFRNYIQSTAMCCNAWLLVAISADRWIRVRFPFKSKQYCRPRNAIAITIIVIILSAGFSGHILGPDYIKLPSGTKTICGSPPSNVAYHKFFNYIWPTLFTCVQTFVPAILCIVLSVDLFYHLNRQSKVQNETRLRRRNQLDNQMLLLMLATIVLFVATTLPLGLYNILIIPVFRVVMSQVQALELLSIVTFINSVNYTLNFYIHCLTSRLFRHELFQILNCRKRNQRVGIAHQCDQTGIKTTTAQNITTRTTKGSSVTIINSKQHMPLKCLQYPGIPRNKNM